MIVELFSFDLADQLSESTSMIDQSRAAASAKHVLLVVDDDAAVRNSLKFLAEIEGFEVNTYSCGRELLNEQRLPVSSCLVTDYHMPEMNGLELVAELRERRSLIPAILITPQPNEDLRNRAAAAGVSIIEKPLLGSRLLDAVREAFDGHPKSPS